jgi:hypothetical protein
MDLCIPHFRLYPKLLCVVKEQRALGGIPLAQHCLTVASAGQCGLGHSVPIDTGAEAGH